MFSRIVKHSVSFFLGQTCVDERSFKEQVVYLGHPYTLQCPLQTQSLPQTLLTWQKNCRQLQNQEGKAFLKFSSITLEDQGNYTCMQQGNNTPSFTVHLVVKGEYKVFSYLEPDSWYNYRNLFQGILFVAVTVITDTRSMSLQSLSVPKLQILIRTATPPHCGGMWDPLWTWTALLCSSGIHQTGSVTPVWIGAKMANHSSTALSTRTTRHHGLLTLLRYLFYSNVFCTSIAVSTWRQNDLLSLIRSPDAGQLIVSSLLTFTLKEAEDFGIYSCTVRNVSSDFSVRNLSKTCLVTFWILNNF